MGVTLAAPGRDALTTDALNSLVHQFSDALCFYRELIQNSLDAQSRTIQVDCTWENGLTTVAVSDQGEGMNRDIIETELTRLFSSSKENDLTKIGKFGVGFVSVFAMEPHAVVVDTSRDGENWRVLFHPDRSYTLIRMEQPFGGTVVRLIKPMSRAEFDDLEQRSQGIIQYWCKYSEAAISYQGRPVNQPFDVESDVKIHYEKSGTEVAAGLTTDVSPFYGFYNRGLTLVEGRQQFFPQVTFRLKSHYLEHTISRDNVMQDENFRKALAVVREAVYGVLYPQFLERLHQGETALLRYVPGLLRDPQQRPPGLMDAPIFAVVRAPARRWYETLWQAEAPKGPVYVSPNDLVRARKKWGAVYYATPPDRMADALLDDGVPVLQGDNLHVLEAAVRAATGEAPVQAGHALYLPPVDKAPSPDERRLLKRFHALTRRSRLPVRRVLLADFRYPGSCIEEEPAVLCAHLDTPNQSPPLRCPLPEPLRSAWLVLNRAHPFVQDSIAAARQDAALAAHGLFHILTLAGILPQAPAAPALHQSLRQRG